MILKGEKFCLTILNDTECIMPPMNDQINKFLVDKFGANIDAITGKKKKVSFDNPGQAGAGNIGNNPLIPNEKDFLYFPFRLISATIVGSCTWKSTDFSNQKVLKASIPLLNNKPAYLNHNAMVGYEIGTVGICNWTGANGGMPAGIDGPYILDSVLYPDLCRKMLSPVSPIQSSSVSIYFDWESSHDFENEWDFYNHVGEQLDGREVTRIVTKIDSYVESSLVYQGADPYAKMKNKDGDGYLNIPLTRSMISNSKYGETDPLVELMKQQKKMYAISNFSSDNVAALRNSLYLKENNLDDKTQFDMSLQKALAKKLNLKEEEITEDLIPTLSFSTKEEFEALSASKKQATDLQTEVSTLKISVETKTGELATLSAEVEKLKPVADMGSKYLESLRASALDAYGKTVSLKVGEVQDEIIVKEIKESFSVEGLHSKIKLFNGKLADNFSAHCTACGSDKVSFKSSENDNESDKNKSYGTHLNDLID